MKASLGDRIRSRRVFRELSQAKLGRLVGVSVDTLRAWEAGHREPRASQLRLLSGFLRCTTDWLLDGDLAAVGARWPSALQLPPDVQRAADLVVPQ